MILGIGIDFLEVRRMDRELSAGTGLADRLFTPREIEYCESKRDLAAASVLLQGRQPDGGGEALESWNSQ